MNGLRLILALAGACWLLQGCETYQDAKRNVAPGGQLQVDTATARADLQRQQTQRTVLEDQKLQRERELERNDKRLRAMEADLAKENKALNDALAAKKVSEQRYKQLKSEMDSIRQEMQQIDLQNKGGAMGAPDAKADAAKEDSLRKLEARKKELETALAQLVGRR
jgi:DNA repair exonuclease SbcCD ATPase subunit